MICHDDDQDADDYDHDDDDRDDYYDYYYGDLDHHDNMMSRV